MDTRTCLQCGETKALIAFYRKQYRCKKCVLANQAEYRRAYPEEVRKCKAESRRRHLQEYRAKSAAYYAANREQKKAWQTEYRKADKERNRAQKRACYLRHREEVKRQVAKYRAANADKVRAGNRRYSQTPKGRAVIAQGRAKRKALLKGCAIADCTEIIAGWRGQTVKCYLCGVSLSGRDCHIDHIIPFALGGEHKPSNIATACPTCNMRKGSKTLDEYLTGQ